MKYVVCDIDGTISKVGERLKYITQNPPDWDKFYEDCFEDEPIKPICDLVKNLELLYKVIFITGRRESVREKTEKWLKDNLNLQSFRPQADLLMRPIGDTTEDQYLKPKLLIERINTPLSNVAFILEDRNSVVTKWRELGFTCLQPAYGDF